MPRADFFGAITAGLGAKDALEQQRLSRQQRLFQLDQQRQGALFQDARTVNSLLKAGQVGQALNVINQRKNFLTQFDGDNADMSDTQEIEDLILNNDIQGASSLLDSVEQAGVASGFLQSTEPNELEQLKLERARLELDRMKSGELPASQKTANARDWERFQDLLESDPEKAKQFGRKVGFIRPTEQEKADIKVDEATRKVVAKANVDRRQGFINSGIEAADGAANMSRALNLLDSIDTGGFDNIALKAKQLFGVEGADEGELSSLMGKAVLAQLKPIFGAAFTAAEGERLEALEARFGRSPATNKRLIENALKIIDRSARRGIAAAEEQGDYFTADEIRNSLAFNLDDKLDANLDTPKASKQTLSDEDLLRKYGGL
jgi:hypothetical protein